MEKKFTKPTLEKMRVEITSLFDDLMGATGLRHTKIARMVSESKFYTRHQNDDFRVGTYDSVKAKFLFLWPENLPWPDGIEKPPEPFELDIAFKIDVAAAYAKKEAANQIEKDKE